MLRACGILLALAALAQAGPAEAVGAAYLDAARYRPREDVRHMRYFWVDSPDLVKFRAAFKLMLNSLSRESEMAGWVEVRPWLWRVDTRDFALPRSVLEKAVTISVHFHIQRGKESYHAPWLNGDQVKALALLTRSNAPVVHAGWWLAQVARQFSLDNKKTGLGYYDVLQIRNRGDYFRLIALDERAAVKAQREARAALEHSDISQLWRQIARVQGATGGEWGTLDSDGQEGEPAIVALRRGEFRHKAEERYGALPNGLPVMLLCDAKGTLQEVAPDFVGPDDSPLRIKSGSKDGRIHAFISCWSCHAATVLRPIDDHMRKTFRGKPNALASPVKKITLELRRQYLSQLDRWLERDRADYRDAIRQATITRDIPLGLDAGTAAAYLVGAYHDYITRPVTLEIAARELGTTSANWLAALHARGRTIKETDLALSAYLTERGTLSRLTWQKSYPKAQAILRGLVELKP